MINGRPKDTPTGGLLPVLMEIGRKRAAIKARMKSALEADDIPTVIQCARELVGLPPTPTK